VAALDRCRWRGDFRIRRRPATRRGKCVFRFNHSTLEIDTMTVTDILSKVSAGEIEASEAATLIEAMKSNGNGNADLSYKVSAKGALSVYGLGRWPLTSYLSAWERIDSDKERKRRAAFIEEHRSEFTCKEK
jgi:hypothetical protein